MTGWLRGQGRAVAAAAAFLTRAPLIGRLRFGAADLPGAAVYFPVVGAAVGALVGGVVLLQVESGVPVLLAAVLAVALEVIVTGALHLDGLADSADGLAGRTPEHALAIMRDHGVGVYGTAAVVLSLVAKTAALASGPSVAVVAAVYAVARAAPLPLAAGLRYARADGTGRALVERLRWVSVTVGLVIAAGLAVIFAGLLALLLLVVMAALVVAVGVAARSRLGGVTGDVLGAAVELTTTAGLFVVAVAA